MLPFLIVSQLLPIHFIYPSCVCGRGSRRTDVGCGCPAINLYLTDGVTTCFQSLQVEALIFCWGTESARLLFLNGPSTSFSKSDCCILSPWSPPPPPPPAISPSWICPSNTKSNRCAYHNANWLENCVESIGAELWPWWHQPLCPFGLKLEKLSAPAFVCSMWHDYWVDDALTAHSWSSGDLFDQSENNLSQ